MRVTYMQAFVLMGYGDKLNVLLFTIITIRRISGVTPQTRLATETQLLAELINPCNPGR